MREMESASGGWRERGAPRRAAGASPCQSFPAPSTTWGCSRRDPLPRFTSRRDGPLVEERVILEAAVPEAPDHHDTVRRAAPGDFVGPGNRVGPGDELLVPAGVRN